MGNEIIVKKLYHIQSLLEKLKKLFEKSERDFLDDDITIAASERNFQLIVNLALDINGIIITRQNGDIPDTYHQSFLELAKMNLLDNKTAELLAEGAKLRNILVHEYNFVEDPIRFYKSAKRMAPAFEQYVKSILDYTQKHK